MIEVNVKDARSNLSALLDRVERGEEVIINRRGKRVAKMVSAQIGLKLPSLKEFRAGIRISGKPMSRTVIDAREKDRY